MPSQSQTTQIPAAVPPAKKREKSARQFAVCMQEKIQNGSHENPPQPAAPAAEPLVRLPQGRVQLRPRVLARQAKFDLQRVHQLLILVDGAGHVGEQLQELVLRHGRAGEGHGQGLLGTLGGGQAAEGVGGDALLPATQLAKSVQQHRGRSVRHRGVQGIGHVVRPQLRLTHGAEDLQKLVHHQGGDQVLRDPLFPDHCIRGPLRDETLVVGIVQQPAPQGPKGVVPVLLHENPPHPDLYLGQLGDPRRQLRVHRGDVRRRHAHHGLHVLIHHVQVVVFLRGLILVVPPGGAVVLVDGLGEVAVLPQLVEPRGGGGRGAVGGGGVGQGLLVPGDRDLGGVVGHVVGVAPPVRQHPIRVLRWPSMELLGQHPPAMLRRRPA
mmetsp:Transcript_49893/g.108924  ORF Transcript_49893/g.108924 Transcript_49893/m.108924 type:complete len:380 (+) Transcript_49893:41-1180(+)